MRKFIYAGAGAAAIFSSACATTGQATQDPAAGTSAIASKAQPETNEVAVTNPLLRPWETPFETPPFAEIEPEHFLPAFEQAFADHAAEIAAITHDPSAPDFSNTITALERSGKLLSKVAAVFYDLVSAHSNPAILEIDRVCASLS